MKSSEENLSSTFKCLTYIHNLFWDYKEKESPYIVKREKNYKMQGYSNGKLHSKPVCRNSKAKRRCISYRANYLLDSGSNQTHVKKFNSVQEKDLSPKYSSPHWKVYFIVSLTSILCYLNSLHGEFVHDDLSAIKGNGDVLGHTRLLDIFVNDFWGKPMKDVTSHKSYRPLTILSFRLNVLVHSMEPFGFHLVNVFLHSVTCLLLLKLCLGVIRAGSLSSLITGLHFATHPIHTEAVAGIVGRADIMAAIFLLISFLFYHRHQKEPAEYKLLWISLSCAFLAMLCKEHGITVLGILIIWDVYLNWHLISDYLMMGKKSSQTFRLFRRLFIIGIGGLTFMTFRVMMLQGALPVFSDQDNPAAYASSKLTRFRTFAYLPAFNFWLLMAPISLSYDWQMHSIPLIAETWSDSRNLIIVLFYGSLLWTVWRVFSKKILRKELVIGLTFLIIPFIPASNLFFHVGFVVAERVLYIPSLGLSIFVGIGAGKLILAYQKSIIRVSLLKICLLMCLGLFVWKTYYRNLEWRNRESLFTSGLKLLPHNAKMHYNYANLQKDLGNTPLAVHHYKEALRLWPMHASALNNVGTLLNDSMEAENYFLACIRINPMHAHAFFNLANLKHQQGQTNLAIRLMERSLELEANNVDALTNLAAMYADLQQHAKAKEIHLRILKLSNSADNLNNYAAFLQKAGRLEEALHIYQEALSKNSNHTVALVNTARLMKKLRLDDSAESLYQRALLQNDDDFQTKDGLGLLYLNTGRPTQALRFFKEALKLSNDPIVKVHLAQAQVHLQKYEDAETVLISAMEQTNSSRREVLYQLSILYSHINRTRDAVKYIQLAIRTCNEIDFSSCAPIHAFYGDLSKDLDEFDSAVLSYKTALEMFAKSLECCKHKCTASMVTHVHLNLGAIFHVQGKYPDAWFHYHAALAQDPNNHVLLQNMEKLKKAETQYKNNSSACHQPPRTQFIPNSVHPTS